MKLKKSILCCLLLFISTFTRATVKRVDVHNASPGDGSTWALAYNNLQTAINASAAGDSLWVAQGTYQPSYGQSFALKEGVRIFGGFSGLETMFSERDWETNRDTLLGNNARVIVNAISPLMGEIPLTPATVLDGFVITGGQSTGEGGGICNRNASPTFRNCIIYGNSAGWGGGMYNHQSAPVLENCVFRQNTSAGGGGLYIEYSNNTQIRNCRFENNIAQGSGGAIYSLSAHPKVYSSIFVGNSADGLGGAVMDMADSSYYVNCLFLRNSANMGGGGARANGNANRIPRYINCTFMDNVSTPDPWGEGDAIYVGENSTSVQVSSCIIWSQLSSNNAQIYKFNDIMPVSNSLVKGGYPGTGNFNFDPLFVDAAVDNYHLTENSPALNTGANAWIPAGVDTDLDGNPRIKNTKVDMGAYEYQAVTPPTNVLYVDSSVAVSGTGRNWSHAFKKLSEALAIAAVNTDVDSILVAKGTYTPSVPASGNARDSTFLIYGRGNLKLLGGYAPGGGSRNTLLYPSVLSGAIGTAAYNDNCYHVMVIANVGSSADSIVVDGFTFTGGYANGSSNFSYRGNSVPRTEGGGLYLRSVENGEKTIIQNCIFFADTASVGGAISMNAAAPYLYGCTFAANTATVATGNNGGGALKVNQSITIDSCIFYDNYSGRDGGALYAGSNVRLNIQKNILKQNRAGRNGGAVYSTFMMKIGQSNVSGNSAINGGGVYISNPYLADFSNILLTGNFASTNGGGLFASEATIMLDHCTVAGNKAGMGGGGLYLGTWGGGDISNSIIYGNNTTSATNPGRKEIFKEGNTFPLSLISCILKDYNPTLTLYVNFVNFKISDPFFQSAPDYSSAPFHTGNYQLKDCSPAIDGGSDSLVPYYFPPFDIAGNPRIAGASTDLGAYEFQGIPAVIAPDTFALGICSNELPLTFGSHSIDTAGMYTHTFTASSGCDSTVTLDLSILPASAHSIVATHCDTAWYNNEHYTSSGTYFQYFSNTHGCDSILTLELTINKSSSDTIVSSYCDSVVINNVTYTESGVYQQHYTNIAGCDSTLVFELTLLKSTRDSITATHCDTAWYNGAFYTASGIYEQHFTNAQNCDSTLVLLLTINQQSGHTITSTHCDTGWYNGQYYTQSGTYTQYFSNTKGCDSVLTLQLTIHQRSSHTIVASHCDSVQYNGISYYQTGYYQQLYTNAVGCDSVLYLDLTLNTSPVVTAGSSAANNEVCAGSSLTLQGSGALSYNWNYNVTDNSPFIPGQTRTYTVTGTDLHGCTDTNTITIQVKPLPVAGIVASGPLTFQLGGSVTLSGTGGNSYEWSNGATSNSIVVDSSGTYTVTAFLNGCAHTSAPVVVTATPLHKIFGKVSNDVNGLNGSPSNTIDGSGTNAGGLYILLIDNYTQQVTQFTGVNANGTFELNEIMDGNYRAMLYTAAVAKGSLAPVAADIPEDWSYVGEQLGTGSGTDGNANGIIQLGPVYQDVHWLRLGIQQAPVAYHSYVAAQPNPGMLHTVQLPSTAFDAADSGPGAVKGFVITAMPDNAKGLLIGTTLYNIYTPVPPTGVWVPADNNGVPALPVAIDPADGAVTVVVHFYAEDEAGSKSNPATIEMPFIAYQIAGRVHHDHNGLLGLPANTIDGPGINPGDLRAVLIRTTENIFTDTTYVDGNGNFSFQDVNAGNYRVLISRSGTFSNMPPPPLLPDGWVYTGEEATAGMGADAQADGSCNLGQVLEDHLDLAFGIQQLPNTNNSPVEFHLNPGDTVTVPVPHLSGWDPEDGNKSFSSSFVITQTPSAGKLYYGGNLVQEGDTLYNYQAGMLRADPEDGATVVLFHYSAIDEAGFADPSPAMNVISLFPVGLSGYVRHDANGMSDDVINGPGIGQVSGEQLYANLIDPQTQRVLGSAPVAANGHFEFSTVRPATNLLIQLSTIPGEMFEPAPETVLPGNWTYTGERLGSGPGNDGESDGTLSIYTGYEPEGLATVYFGIEQLPEAYDKSINLSSATVHTAIALTESPEGNDPEDGVQNTGCTFIFGAQPTCQARISYAGTDLEEGARIANFNPAALTVTYQGAVDHLVQFEYQIEDAAGLSSAPATYSITTGQVLPVKWLEFYAVAEGNTALLNWTTAAELHNAGFDIERSADGRKFEKIAFEQSKAANGNSSEVLRYKSIDHKPLPGDNYYRIAQQDQNGGTNYSETRLLRFTVEAVTVQVYPNPTFDRIYIQSTQAGYVTEARLMDVNGRVLLQINQSNISDGIDLTPYASGAYLLQIKGADGKYQQVHIIKK